MTHAEKCPVCEGKGKLEKDVTCHGCNGLGWVTVGMDYPVFYPSYPVYPQPVWPLYEPYVTYTSGSHTHLNQED